MRFDIFTIRQWQEGYTLEVRAGRPRNAPRYKYTHADQKRDLAATRKNLELHERMFATLDEVMAEIKKLQFPIAEQDEQTPTKEDLQA